MLPPIEGFLPWLAIFGTAVFAISGALAGLRQQLDIVGVTFVATLTGVGGGTLRADDPSLDVRLAGLEDLSPQRIALTSGSVPEGWISIRDPKEIHGLQINSLFVEGGAATAASFLRARLVDRLLLYRAPILIGKGLTCLGDIGLAELTDAHGQWNLLDSRMFGPDRMELYADGQAA